VKAHPAHSDGKGLGAAQGRLARERSRRFLLVGTGIFSRAWVGCDGALRRPPPVKSDYATRRQENRLKNRNNVPGPIFRGRVLETRPSAGGTVE